MIGLVFVSHSRALAEALINLVQQVASRDIPMAIAAGVGDNREEFGTDAVEISEAIQSVYSPEGVLVLMDLGSAILSAEVALELLPEEMRARVRFCAAPLVEGAIAAGVQAGLGSDLDTSCREAQGALIPKAQQLGESESIESAGAAPEVTMEGAQEVTLTLRNEHGLHARPAARFVQTAASFDARVQVRNLTSGKGPVSAKSLNALATLGAVRDDQILVSATGPQANQALDALNKLVADNFGERELLKVPTSTPQLSSVEENLPEGVMQAVPVSEGIALGPLYRYQPPLPPIPDYKPENPDPEWTRLQRALDNTRQSIKERRQRLIPRLGEAESAIFDAHLLIIEDPDLLDQVHEHIYQKHQNASAAWNCSIASVAESYRSLDDPYLKQRAADVTDVGNQVLFALAEKSAAKIELSEPVILFAEEITPTETAQLDMRQILGLITVGGGPTSHSAILARALGIPALSGIDVALEKVPDNTPVVLDGFKGFLWIDPDPETRSTLQERRDEWLNQRKKLQESSLAPATMRDGRHIEVAANAGSLLDARSAIENGAEGIGLLRTEFLYLTRQTPPSEEEQFNTLQEFGQIIGNRPIIVRTLDVGGDKELPYLHLTPEANPFLGVRAIRISLRNPELFNPQLRAILRAGADHHMRIMFPMVANRDEIRMARKKLEQIHQALQEENIPHGWPIETGIMVEVPAAAVLSSTLAEDVDFFSIGTNDLTQYTLAAERGNPELSAFADALHPAVLHLIKQVIEAAHAHGKWAGICGELAGDPLATPILAGLGIDELSMTPVSIPRVKELLRRIDQTLTAPLVDQVLSSDSAETVRNLAKAFLENLPEAQV
jgi:phosphoenolpyruvate-protein phosphotransferase/dihydroxyacetone kinase phosphotransfer subunit